MAIYRNPSTSPHKRKTLTPSSTKPRYHVQYKHANSIDSEPPPTPHTSQFPLYPLCTKPNKKKICSYTPPLTSNTTNNMSKKHYTTNINSTRRPELSNHSIFIKYIATRLERLQLLRHTHTHTYYIVLHTYKK